MADESPRELAQRLTAADGAPALTSLAPRSDDEWAALAWALKDDCQAAWTEEPPRTQRCVDVIEALQQRVEHSEIGAAAAWCRGLALLAQGQMEATLACLDQAQRKLIALGQTQRAAQSQVPRVIALSMLGRHDEALASGQQTLGALIAVADEFGAGKVELNLGWMLMRRDRYDQAMQCFKGAAVRFARVGDETHSIMADIGQASARTWRFEFDEASRLYDRCEMRVGSRELASLRGGIDTNRGRMELHRGRFEAALRALTSALDLAQTNRRPHDVAESRRDLADAYLALNLLPEAIALYGQTIDGCIALEAPVERAWAEVQRSLAWVRCGDAQRAADGLTQARVLFEADDNRVGIALTDLCSAALSLQMGLAGMALRDARAAARALEATGVDGWRREAELLVADALAALGQIPAARAMYEQVLDAAAELPQLLAPCHTALGLLLYSEGRRDAAREQLRSALVHTELQRDALPSDEFRTAFGADKQRPYDALIDLAFDSPATDAGWRLLEAIEQARAPALRSALQRRDTSAAIDEAKREQLRWLQAQWQQAIAEQDLERASQLQGRTRALEHEFLEQVRRAQAAAGATVAAQPLRLPADEAQVRGLVPEGTAVVVYARVGPRLAACVVTRERIDSVVVSADGVADRIEKLRFQIDSLRFGAPALRAHASQMAQRCIAHLQALHASVWQPLARFVCGYERIVIVPHRELHYLPFAALHDGQTSLIERHEISLAPGLALWLAETETVRPWRHVAALGAGGDALPHVAREVRAVAAAFQAQPGGSAVMHLEAQATQAALRASLAGADVLHLACHGQFRADSPYFSALQLADGPLTVRDAAELPLAAQLVTLSACETGLSKVAPGDELLGLLRGFLMAGAPRVLCTQWTVDDASTAVLMAQFYRSVLGGARPAMALRAAQRALACEQPHPHHWAAFALHERGH